MEKKDTTGKIIKTCYADETPVDLAISMHLQNLFATYGETKVRETVKELFGMGSTKTTITKAS